MFKIISKQFRCTLVRQFTCTNAISSKKNGVAQNWAKRQSRDPYVKDAALFNYRCRSAFKLLEIDDKCHILKPGHVVIDCGAAPGSWTQVAVDRVNALGAGKGKAVGKVISVDKQHFQPIPGAQIILKDFTKASTKGEIVLGMLDGRKANVVISDMAPTPSGMKSLDHQIICKLATDALIFSREVLVNGGHFLCKIWQGGEQKQLHSAIADNFKTVRVLKPSASRAESAEVFLLGLNFKGLKTEKTNINNKDKGLKTEKDNTEKKET